MPALDTLPELFFQSVNPIVYRSSGALVREFRIPYTVPIPAVFQPDGWADIPIAPTLGHMVAMASADRRYLHAVEDVTAFVPLLVAALARLPPDSLPHVGFPVTEESPEVQTMSEQAARWLARTLPSGMLSPHPAEQAIYDLVLRLLPGRGLVHGPAPHEPPPIVPQTRIRPYPSWGVAEA